MTNEREIKRKFPKRILIDDEKIQFFVIKRIDELLHREKPTTKLARTLSTEFDTTPIAVREIVSSAKIGENLKIPYYTYFSTHFHINLCNFFNPDMQDWDKKCVEIDELENLFNRMVRVIEYAKYSGYILIRTNVLTGGSLRNVFSQSFYKTIQLMMNDGYDFDKACKISLNHVIRLSALSNIPVYAFFMVDDDAFESILKEKCATASEILDRYSSPNSFIGTRREKRQRLILENNTDVLIDARHYRYPIMDSQIRRAIIDHFQMIKDSRGYTLSHIADGAGLTESIIYAISHGMNSHLINYLKVCDFFHVRINDFLNPNIKHLPTFRKKNVDIDFYTQFENAFKKARQDANNLASSDETIQNLYSIWANFISKPKGAYKEYVTDEKEAVKHRIFLNTLIDFAKSMNVTIYDLLSDNSIEPEKFEIRRLKPIRGRARIKYISDNTKVGGLPIDLRDLIYDYACLNDDRKKAALDIVRFLATKQRAENSGDTETLNQLNEQLAELNK